MILIRWLVVLLQIMSNYVLNMYCSCVLASDCTIFEEKQGKFDVNEKFIPMLFQAALHFLVEDD